MKSLTFSGQVAFFLQFHFPEYCGFQTSSVSITAVPLWNAIADPICIRRSSHISQIIRQWGAWRSAGTWDPCSIPFQLCTQNTTNRRAKASGETVLHVNIRSFMCLKVSYISSTLVTQMRDIDTWFISSKPLFSSRGLLAVRSNLFPKWNVTY
jgi:hypothetical protein